MTTRTGPGAAVALALLLLVGCGDKPAPPPGVAPSTPRVPPGPPAPSGTPAADSEAMAAAQQFLSAADKGSPDVAKLSPAFKQLIAPPTTAADQSRGYSDWAAEQWLKETLTGKARYTALWSGSISPDAVIFTATDQGKPGRVVLRLAKSGSGFLVDWVHVGPQKDPVNLDAGGDKLASSFAVHAFLDTLVTGKHALAESLLTTACKARIAPPLNDPLGYNRAMLGVKLAALRGKATEWKASGSESTLTGHLLEPGGKERPFKLKLEKGTQAGEWLVDDFDVK